MYLDEDTRHNKLLQALCQRGVDVITVAEANMMSRSDEEQLNWAFDNQRVIYSFNVRDFYRLHTTWINQKKFHAGIILGQQNYSIDEISIKINI